MNRMLLLTALLGIAPPLAVAVDQEHFQLRTAADLVALCTAGEKDPLHSAAVHMCHGFGAGTYQTIQAMTQHEKLKPLFCPPSPGPSRNQAVADFVAWTRSHADLLDQRPVEVIGRYLVDRYPCAKAK